MDLNSTNIVSGVPELSEKLYSKPPKYLVLLLVNAAVSPQKQMDKDPKKPAIIDQLTAASEAQINRYNIETIQLLKESVQSWAAQLSEKVDYEVKPFFIQVDFNGIQDKQRNRLLNTISTSLALPAEQVDKLREVAKELLYASAEFQRLLSELNSQTDTPVIGSQ